jgi:hypothetical protein
LVVTREHTFTDLLPCCIGNCLFNALSDQIYGHQDEHANIRARVITHMREQADYYKQFIDVHPGGGIRRNPKRKNAGAYSMPSTNTAPPSSSEIDRVFESHLQSMARGGTWGDNMEITAFAAAFAYDVKIYQRDFAFIVSPNPSHETPSEQPRDPTSARPTAHIAYHAWEHYSSIRNLDGPHAGPPNVLVRVLTPQEEQAQKDQLARTPQVLPWQIDVVEKSLPFLADKPTIKRALEASRGDINAAVSRLLDADEENANSSIGSSSYQESSSVERDQDSEDDVHAGPKKRQDRRRSSRGGLQGRTAKRADAKGAHALSNIASFTEIEASSQESLAGVPQSSAGWDSETSSSRQDAQSRTSCASTQPSSVEENFTEEARAESASSTKTIRTTPQQAPRRPWLETVMGESTFAPSLPAVSTATTTNIDLSKSPNTLDIAPDSSKPAKPTVRLKLLPPRPPPPPNASSGSSQQRVSARDRKDMKKLAQKAARKERQQQQIRSHAPLIPIRAKTANAPHESATGAGSSPEKPPVVVETLRTLYI